MKKFNFSLQKVLEIKQQLLENTKIELSTLNSRHTRVLNEIKTLQCSQQSLDDEFKELCSKNISVPEITYYRVCLENMESKIRDKEAKRDYLKLKIEKKKRELMEKNIEISSLEKLREKELEKHNEALSKSEQLRMDEFVTTQRLNSAMAFGA